MGPGFRVRDSRNETKRNKETGTDYNYKLQATSYNRPANSDTAHSAQQSNLGVGMGHKYEIWPNPEP